MTQVVPLVLCALVVPFRTLACMLMPPLLGVLVLLWGTDGLPSNCLLCGRSLAEIFAGLRRWLLSYSSTSLNRSVCTIATCLSTPIIRGPLVRWRRGVALTPISISLSAVLMLSFLISPFLQKWSILNPQLILPTPSHAEIRGRPESRCSQLLCSQGSYPIVFFMFSLN